MRRSSVEYGERVYPFPTEVLERVGNILTAYNASAKAITQLIVTRAPATRLELSKRFEEVVAGTALEETDSYNVNKYCFHSLCPLGLVSEETMPVYGRYHYTITYALTEAGARYGQPAAAFFLAFEQGNGISLFSVLGNAYSTTPDDPKPTLTRALLLCELAKGSKRTRELENILHLSESVTTRSLARLARAGAITYSTLFTHTGETQVTFSVAEKTASQAAAVGGFSKLTPTIALICRELHKRHVPITQSTVSAALLEKQERRSTDETVRKMVSEVLAGLAQQGYLKRLQFSRESKSMATITEKGICVVEKLIKPLMEAMQDGNTLKRWQYSLLPKVQRELPFYAQHSAALYYPLSKSQDKPAKLDKLAMLQKILQTSSGITVTQLARKLHVSQVTVSSYLRQLENTYPINKKIYNSVTYYSLHGLRQKITPHNLADDRIK